MFFLCFLLLDFGGDRGGFNNYGGQRGGRGGSGGGYQNYGGRRSSVEGQSQPRGGYSGGGNR